MEARVKFVRSRDPTRTSCTHERTCVGAANALTNWASQTDIVTINTMVATQKKNIYKMIIIKNIGNSREQTWESKSLSNMSLIVQPALRIKKAPSANNETSFKSGSWPAGVARLILHTLGRNVNQVPINIQNKIPDIIRKSQYALHNHSRKKCISAFNIMYPTFEVILNDELQSDFDKWIVASLVRSDQHEKHDTEIN